MSPHDFLAYSRLNQRNALEAAQREVAAGHPSAEALFAIGFSWRILALCALLEEADTGTFANFLARSGQARRALLRQARQGLACPPRVLCTSKDLFFAASLAAGDLSTARDIATLAAPSHFEGVEYEDDFLFYHFLHRTLVAPEDTARLEALLERWDAVLEGGDSAYRDVCRELTLGDAKTFEAAFMALLRERQETLRAYARDFTADRELVATEGKVFVEGLALLRLAEPRGLPTLAQYPLIPRLARVPAGRTPPPPDAWLSPPDA